MRWLKRRLPIPRIAVLRLRGGINSLSAETYLPLIRALAKDKHVKGVLLIINSPGGSGTATDLIYSALKRLDQEKPLFVLVTEVAASGGYWLACSARKVIAMRSSLVGSIGIIGYKPILREVLARIGVELDVTKRGKYKDMYLFNRPYTDEEKAKVEALFEEFYQQFVDVVADERNLQPDGVRDLATGEVFTARTALAHGLIDDIGDFEDALDALSKETGVHKDRVMNVEPRRGYLKQFVQSAVVATMEEVDNQLRSETFLYRR